MWQNISRVDYPRSDQIKVGYETNEILNHKFTIKVGGDNEVQRQILALTYDEAVALQEKLGFAVQDYDRASLLTPEARLERERELNRG